MTKSLISVKRKSDPEEIHEATFDDSGNILSSKKIDIQSYPEEIIESLKIAEKYTIAHKSEIFSCILNLREKKILRSEWPEIDAAIELFNSESFLNETVPEWKPVNTKGRGEAQFHLLFDTDQTLKEPDICISKEEGYSIKYFGKNGKKSVLSGEFINKDQTSTLEKPIREIMKVLQVPNEIRISDWSPGEISNIQNEYLSDCIKFAPYDDWSKIKLASGISKADVQFLIEDYKKVCEDLRIMNYEESLHFLLIHLKKNLEELKSYLLSEHEGQKGIIGIFGNSAHYINDVKKIRVNYIRPTLRVSFSAMIDEKEAPGSAIEDLLSDI